MPEIRRSMSRLPAVVRRVGLGRDALYRLIRQGKFPKPFKLTERTSAWDDDEIDAFLRSRPRARLDGSSPIGRRKTASPAEPEISEGAIAAPTPPVRKRRVAGAASKSK